MTVIENEHGRFEAETEAEALKLARKAKREAKRAEQREQAAQRQAGILAREAAFRVYDAVAGVLYGDRDRLPKAWRWKRPGERYSAASVVGPRDVDFDLECGRVRLHHYGCTVEGVLVNGAGFAMAAEFVGEDGRHGHLSALGGLDGQIGTAPMALPAAQLKALLEGRDE